MHVDTTSVQSWTWSVICSWHTDHKHVRVQHTSSSLGIVHRCNLFQHQTSLHCYKYFKTQYPDRFRTLLNHLTFEVLTSASVKVRAFCDVAPCSPVGLDRRFRGAYRLNYHGDSPCWWRQYAPLKRRSTPTLHGATSQKAPLFILLNYLRYEVLTAVERPMLRFRVVT
jgi:hypothetical protein